MASLPTRNTFGRERALTQLSQLRTSEKGGMFKPFLLGGVASVAAEFGRQSAGWAPAIPYNICRYLSH